MPATLRIETIGKCVIYVGDRRIDQTAEVLLAGLLLVGLEPGKKRSRAQMCEWLWPKATRAVQGTRMRWLLSKIRSVGVVLSTEGVFVGIDRGTVHTDFDSVDHLDGILQGPILDGYEPRLSTAYATWIEEQRSRIRLSVVDALARQMTDSARISDWRTLTLIARSILAIDCDNEGARLQLAEALSRSGHRKDALTLLSELGEASPEVATKARLLEQRIRASDWPSQYSQPRFVGRGEILRSIDALLHSATERRGSGLLLSGPAGIGKTRLLDEARLRATLSDIRVVRVRCQRADLSRPLSAVTDLVTALLKLPGSLGCDPDKLDRLKRLITNEDQLTPAAPITASPAWVRVRLVEALADLLAAVSDECALLLEIDDLQWADDSLEWVWKAVVASSAVHRVAWLFAYRTSRRARPMLEVPEISIPALDHHSAEELLTDLIDRYGSSDVDRGPIIQRGAGSPLFLGELVRQSSLRRISDGLPNSIVSLLDAGIADLSKHALRVLQVAAVLGTHTTLRRIESVARLPRPEFLDAVGELEKAGILTTDAFGETTGHILWSEAAMARITANVSRLLHRHAAEEFELELRDSAQAALVWECAQHWKQAGDLERAKRAVLLGAATLSRNGFPEDAAAAYARAISWATDPAEKLALLDERLQLLEKAGRWSDVVPGVDQYDELAHELDPLFDGHSSHELRRWRAAYYLTGNHHAMALSAHSCAASASASLEHRLAAAREAALAAEFQSFEQLVAIHRLVENAAPKTISGKWNLIVLQFSFHMRCGDLDEAQRLAERAVTLAPEHSEPIKASVALGMVAAACGVRGEIANAYSACRERIEVARRFGNVNEIAAAYDHWIGTSLDFDPADASERLIGEFERFAERFGDESNRVLGLLPRFHRAQLSATLGDSNNVLRLAPNAADVQSFAPRWKARLMAIRILGLGTDSETDESQLIRTSLPGCFNEPNYWMDWPAQVCARLLRHQSEQAAAAFATRYVQQIRRERYSAPASLRELSLSRSRSN